MNKTTIWLQHFLLYAKAMLKWLAVSVVVGILCGLLGSAFHYGVSKVTMIRELNPRIIWFLPLGGLLAVAIYKLFHTEGQGTNNVLQEIQNGKGVSLNLIPAIFLTTVLTHLVGGSAFLLLNLIPELILILFFVIFHFRNLYHL